jgi:urease accessory protein
MAAEDPSSAALYRLMAWLSPSYPIGAFSYSSGIEWAVRATSRMPTLRAGSPS